MPRGCSPEKVVFDHDGFGNGTDLVITHIRQVGRFDIDELYCVFGNVK